MSWIAPKIPRWYHHWLPWVLLVLAAGAFFGGGKMKSRYLRWIAGRQVSHAATFIAKKEYPQALSEAKGALEADPMHPGATRVVAQTLEETGSAAVAAKWRSRLETIQPGDRDNILAWVSDLVEAKDADGAEHILAMLKPVPVDDAGYHAAAAGIAMARRDDAGAERHWAEAARLDPPEDHYRLQLAAVRLGSKNAGLRTAAVAILKDLSGKPANRAEALRALLGDATYYTEWERALELADALVADHAATFPDRIARLATLRAMKSPDATAYLHELRDGALSTPGDLYLLCSWMNQHNLALLVSDWSRTLPPGVTGGPPVCVAIADAYVRGQEWKRLRGFLDGRKWGDSDYLRRAFLTRALEKLDEAEEAAREWQDGIAAARSHGDAQQRLEKMARLAIAWGWEQRARDVMWTLTGSPECPRWVLDALWTQSLNHADTAQLQKLAGLRAQADSRSVAFRNSHAFYSLLIRSEDGNPHREAERLFGENPGHADIAVTWGLSLYQRGRVAEAAAVTAALPAAALRQPQVALYHAIFLTAVGESAKAAEFLTIAEGWQKYPEEKALLDRARISAQQTAHERDIARAMKAARAARAARELEAEKAVEAATILRARQAAQDAAAVK